MEFTSRLKGLLDRGILAGAFDADSNESLRRYLPQDQIDLIPADKRDQFAQMAFRANREDGYGAAQKRLLDFAAMPAAQETARRERQLRADYERDMLPYTDGGVTAMQMASERGAYGPTRLAASMMQMSPQEALRIKMKYGKDFTKDVRDSLTPIERKPGVNIDPMTGEETFTPQVPVGMNYNPRSRAVSLAPGLAEATGVLDRQKAGIETQAAIDRQPLMRVDGPDGATLVGSITGTPPPARPGMPQPAGRPGVAPQPQPGMDYDSQIEEAVMAGNAQQVARLQAEQARAMGRPAPMGITEAYKQAQKVFEGRTAADLKTASDALVKTVQPSFDGAIAARGSLDKTYELKNLIRSGVYTKQGIIPGDYVEMAARVFGNDPEKLANTRALKVASLQSLLDMAAKLKPASDTDIKLLNSGISNPDSMTEREMMRITDNLIADHKKTIKGHGDTLKRFPADRLATAFGGMNLSVDEPTDPYERTPARGQNGLGTPSVSGRVGGQPARPGFTFREVK
jgi:hypothetical protein